MKLKLFLLTAVLCWVHLNPAKALAEPVEPGRISPGWAIAVGGGLGVALSQTGIHRTRDANERFLYYGFQAVSAFAIGYGLHLAYGVSEFDAYKEELDLLDLPPETRQNLLELYLKSTQRAQKVRDKARGLSLLATSALLLVQLTTEEHAKTQTALGVASGLCLLGGLTYTF